MNDLDRLKQYPTTEKQRSFEWDFTKGVENYEVWDEIEIGASGTGARTYRIEEEDVVDFNKAALETDPSMVDLDYARANGVLKFHPLFTVQIAFYCVDTGIGSWIRTPGARNPGQVIDLVEPYQIGEEITATITHDDKWVRRGNYYMRDKVEFRNEHGTLKTTWFVTLLLPKTREDVQRFASA